MSVPAPCPTTVVRSARLSELLGVELTIASETLQETGSFKFRAASNVVRGAPNRLFVTVSSGNFGQALARAAALAGKRAIVAMPSQSAQGKVDAVRSWGAEVDLIDTAKVSRSERLAQLAAEHPDAYVASPYDDPLVISGNATLGHEIADLGATDAVVVPIGGGGLASGVIAGLKERLSTAQVWAAEPALANDAARSLRSGRIETNENGEAATIADGARTLSVGQHNWPILQRGLAGVIEVSEEAIREGVRLLFSLANLKVEPTGALPIAALLTDPERFRGRRVVAVVSGGNVDPALYSELIG